MAGISLCMIVKNEEKVLARCLDSICNAVDEIIITDTGSTDHTKEIAKKYTDLVYDFKWADDFSLARNFSFSKASKDYLMWLDADDVITEENGKALLELKDNLHNEDAVMMKYNTQFDENDNPTFSFYRERLIRRDSFISWRGRVHETIEYIGQAIYSDIAVNHKSVKTQYSTRNLDIYEKQLEEEKLLNPRDTFYFARELYYHKQYDRAIKILSEFLDSHQGWYENKIEACKILSFCYNETGKKDHALTSLFKSFAYDTPRAEICCLVGNIFMEKAEYEKAVFWFETALTLPAKDKNGGFMDIDSYGYLPCIQLCVCYDKLKDYKAAEKYNLRAGTYRPDSEAYLQNEAYFHSLHQKGIIE